MSWKISRIAIKNFKFFHEPFLLNLNGKNLLLYGENGCGKSSIYWSFYTHFQACLKTKEQVGKYFDPGHSENLRNRFANPDEESSLLVDFVEEGSLSEHSYCDSSVGCYINDPASLSFMNSTLKASDFINYKFLTSIFDFSNSQYNNVFRIFEKEFFQCLPLRPPMFGSSFPAMPSNSAEEFWQEIKKNIRNIPQSNSGRYIVTNDEHRKVVAQVDEFNDMLKDALEELVATANNIISDKFDIEVELQMRYVKATFNDFVSIAGKKRNQRLIDPQIVLNARMTNPNVVVGTPIEHPRSFFNEAKLTQMALSLRLAILDLKPSAGANNNSTVFVDDLLISLDMSCRRKVIDVMLEYSVNRQFVVMTHDRNFFYLFKSAIERRNDDGKWKYIEMYAPNENGVPKPHAIENLGYLIKARYFLDKLEMPAAINYLRKACEHELKRILPENLRIENVDSGKSLSLNSLVKNFNEFTRKHNFPQIVNSFTDDRKLILNPFSHDDLHCQVYRLEVDTLCRQIKKLESVKVRMLVDYDKVRTEKFQMEMMNNNHTSSVTFEFCDRFDVMSYEGINYYGNPKVKIISSNVDKIKKDKLYVLNKVHTIMLNSLSLVKNTAPDILDCTKEISSGSLLRAL